MLSERAESRILQLVNDGVAYRKIITKIRKEEGEKVSISTISRLVNLERDEFFPDTLPSQAPQKKRVSLSQIIKKTEPESVFRDSEVDTIMGISRERSATRNLPIDPIDREIWEEDRELAREGKRLRLETLIAKRERRIEELRNSGDENENTSSTFSDMVQANPLFIASLNQEELTKLSLLGSVGNPQAMLPFIKSNDTTLHDIVEIIQMMRPEPKPQTIANEEEIVMLLKALAEKDGVQMENVQN